MKRNKVIAHFLKEIGYDLREINYIFSNKKTYEDAQKYYEAYLLMNNNKKINIEEEQKTR